MYAPADGSGQMGGGNDDQDEAEKNKQAEDNIEIWKIKKLIKSLQAARGCVTVTTASSACRMPG